MHLLLTIAALLFGFSSARCACKDRLANYNRTAASQTLFASLTLYSNNECQKACCSYGSRCAAYERVSVDFERNHRGPCKLFSGVLLDETPSPGYVVIFVETTPAISSCEVNNVLYGKTVSGSGTVVRSETTTPSSCKDACCSSPSCNGFTFTLSSYVEGTSGICSLYTDVSSTSADSSMVVVDVSSCQRQPLSPPPLSCSSGDPIVDNVASKGRLTLCSQVSPCVDNTAGNDGNPATSTPTMVSGSGVNAATIDFGATQQFVGIVNVVADSSIITSSGTGGDYPSEGFFVMVGELSSCQGQAFVMPDCPVCGRATRIESSRVYKFDCRGLRGRFLRIYAPGNSRAISFSEIDVQPAPYFPSIPDAYPLYSALGCCNDGQGPVTLSVEALNSGTNTQTFDSQTANYSPWIQIYLGPLQMPVGRVLLEFPTEAAVFGMFRNLPNTNFIFTDDEYDGFTIGVSDRSCPTTVGGLGGKCQSLKECAVIRRVSFPGTGNDPSIILSQYYGDCEGVAGNYVFVQLATRIGQGSSPKLSASRLTAFVPSRIAPAIYPVRTSFSGATLLDEASTQINVLPTSNNSWQQKTLLLRSAVGIVTIESANNCLINVLRQNYLLSDVFYYVRGQGISETCGFVDSQVSYFGSDQGAIVGVSDTPCDPNTGCTGFICGRITTNVTSSAFHVDCRGVVGQYVFIMLPQPKSVLLRAIFDNSETNNFLPVRNTNTTTIVLKAYAANALVTNDVSPTNVLAQYTSTTEAVCITRCYNYNLGLCKAWTVAASVCTLYYEFVVASDRGSFSGSSGEICQYQNVADSQLQPGALTPYNGYSWLNFPQIILPIPLTENPTKSPTPNPTAAPTPLPTLFPTNAPTLFPTSAPTLFPTNAPTSSPTNVPTLFPTNAPTLLPTIFPTNAPTLLPTSAPTLFPTETPTLFPTSAPTTFPTSAPTLAPTTLPTAFPTPFPTQDPTLEPTVAPTATPTTLAPTALPTTAAPTIPGSTLAPTTLAPTALPTTLAPTALPTTLAPTTLAPTALPTTAAPTIPGSTLAPTTLAPTALPTTLAPTTLAPTGTPTTLAPTILGSTVAPTTLAPTALPTTAAPTILGSTLAPTTLAPTALPTTLAPTALPTTAAPTILGSTLAPTTLAPTALPTTLAPTALPTTAAPTILGSTLAPTTLAPTALPTTLAPTTLAPTTQQPTLLTALPTSFPSGSPTSSPTPSTPTKPTRAPIRVPTGRPTRQPTRKPSRAPTRVPTRKPTRLPTAAPTRKPTSAPTTRAPNNSPTRPTAVTSGFCATKSRCYECTQAGCQWIQSSTTMGCVPTCSSITGCRKLVGQCPESVDPANFCAERCGAQVSGCSCLANCKTNCCFDFNYSCPVSSTPPDV